MTGTIYFSNNGYQGVNSPPPLKGEQAPGREKSVDQNEAKPQDSSPKVYVLIIDPDANNTDSYQRHQLNVERSFNSVQPYHPDGVFVLAPDASEKIAGENVLFTEEPSQDSLGRAVTAIKDVIRPNDHLLIFITGHGNFNEITKEACLSFPEARATDPADPENVTETEFGNMLAQLPKINKTIFMDACFGGEWIDTLSSPSTFFVANSGREESTFCEPWVRRLNSPDVPDLNGDGLISNVERVIYASEVGQIFGVTTSMGYEYIDYGYGRIAAAPLYPAEVKHIHTKKEFDFWRNLNPYGVIVLKFGAEWCPPCVKFTPHFDAMAQKYKGRVLFLDVDLTADVLTNELYRNFGEKKLPSVFILKGTAMAEMQSDDTERPARIEQQIDQMLGGTHPALFVSMENTRSIAEDRASPVPLRARAVKLESDKPATPVDWVVGFLNDPEWQVRRAALETLWNMAVFSYFPRDAFKDDALASALAQKICSEIFPPEERQYYSDNVNDYDNLNKLILMEPKFYGYWQVNFGNKIALTKETEELAAATKESRGKKFLDLTGSEIDKIARLNRLLLEATYPQLCPKSNIPKDRISINIHERILSLAPKLLRGDSIEVRTLAAQYITELEEYPEVIKGFIGEAIHHPDPLVRMAAAYVIRQMADPSFFPLILELAEDSDPLVQKEGLSLIREWKLKDAVLVLNRVIASKSTPSENREFALIVKKCLGEKALVLSNKSLENLRAELALAKGSKRRIPLAAQIYQLEQKGK